jgi:hypothetical protein
MNNNGYKQLVFTRNTHTHTHTPCLIIELGIEIEYISYTSYFKSKNNFKSSIIHHTHIYALKPSYSCIKV